MPFSRNRDCDVKNSLKIWLVKHWCDSVSIVRNSLDVGILLTIEIDCAYHTVAVVVVVVLESDGDGVFSFTKMRIAQEYPVVFPNLSEFVRMIDSVDLETTKRFPCEF